MCYEDFESRVTVTSPDVVGVTDEQAVLVRVKNEQALSPVLRFGSDLSFSFRHEEAMAVKMFLLRLVKIGMSHFNICMIYLRNKSETSQCVWLRMNLNMSKDTSLLKVRSRKQVDTVCWGPVMCAANVSSAQTCLHTHTHTLKTLESVLANAWGCTSTLPLYAGKCPCN